jgi:Tol biopolymer transport system component
MGAPWLALPPLASFLLVFGVTYAAHDGNEGTSAPRAAGPERGGARILVSIRGPSPLEAYLHSVRLDGSGLRRLTRPARGGRPVADEAAALSPDGRRLALSRHAVDGNRFGPLRLYSAASDGSRVRPLTRATFWDANPAWSPDGSRIAFARIGVTARTETADIWTVRPDGGGLRRLTAAPRTHENMPAWSPDSRRIAYSVERERGGELLADIWVMNAGGSERRRVLGGPHADTAPAWSADGSRIAFIRDGRLATMNADGKDVRLLSREGVRYSRPLWSSDGELILCTREPGEVVMVKADGSGEKAVRLDRDAFAVAWEPAR